MKIVIDIPEVFIAHWEMDRFKDSLRRMKADADMCELCSGNYEAELCEMLITAFEEAHEIPVPHGDLIDKKNLSDDLQRRWNVSDDQDFCNKEVWHALEEAPTIIEAEE